MTHIDAPDPTAQDPNAGEADGWLGPLNQQRGHMLAVCGLLLGVAIATGLRLFYVLEHPDFLWYDSEQYIDVAQHSIFSTALWSGSQPPLVPLLWKFTQSATAFCVVQSLIAALAWGTLATTVWHWLGRGARGCIGAWVVLAFSLSPFILQWDASVLTESISLSAIAVFVASGILVVRRFTWVRVVLLVGSGVVFELARDEGIEVIAVVGVAIGVLAIVAGLKHHADAARRWGLVAVIVLGSSALIALAAQQAHRNVLNVENSLFVRIFPYPDKVAAFSAEGMPQGHAIDAVAKLLAAQKTTSLAYASPVPSSSIAVVVGPILDNPYWHPLRTWFETRGESAYLRYLVLHPSYVVSAPFHQPSLAFNSPSTLAYYDIEGHPPLAGVSLFFPRRIFVYALAALATVLLVARRLWRRREVAFVAALIPLGCLAMVVAWFGDGQEVARHMIEGNVMVRLSVWLLVLWGLLGPSPTTMTSPARTNACDD